MVVVGVVGEPGSLGIFDFGSGLFLRLGLGGGLPKVGADSVSSENRGAGNEGARCGHSFA